MTVHDTQDAEESTSHGQERSPKRRRYAPKACDECKRRKVKCDGQTPCHRCKRVSTGCVYAQRGGNNVESRQDLDLQSMNQKITMLQEQIGLLISSAVSGGVSVSSQPATATPLSTSTMDHSTLSQHPSRTDPSGDSRAQRKSRAARHPQYLGPTSSAFTLGVANNSLQRMGIQSESDLVDDAIGSYLTTPTRTPVLSKDALPTWDPLLSISRYEAMRLIDTYEEETGTIYPFLDLKRISKSAEEFYNGANLLRGSSAVHGAREENMLSGGILDILKLVIAIALVVEGRGPTALSVRLLDSVESGFDGRLCGSSVDILEIQAWTLMSILQFHCNEEVLAWRTIGFAGRAAVEMGLHRREMYFARFHNHQDRLWANKLFWCIYVLDRRWSFGTGLPFVIHDDDIDPELPEPKDSEHHVLKIMIAYGRIGSKVWKATSNSDKSDKKEETAYLDFKVREWQSSIAPELQLHPSSSDMLEGHSRTRNRLRVLLYLRANQMRLLIYRRSLMSSTSIMEDPASSQQVVNIAKDTIRVLDKLNRLSDIYSSQQTCFNYFLVSALAVIFLAVCHSPTQFNQTCREEFFLALELVRGFSARSYVARKLWKTIKHLKVIGPKLGIFPNQEQQVRQLTDAPQGFHSLQSPTSGQQTLGTQQDLDFDELNALLFEPAISPTYSFQLDGNQLSYELTNMFEAIEPRVGEQVLENLEEHGGLDLYNYGTAEDLSRSLLNLF